MGTLCVMMERLTMTVNYVAGKGKHSACRNSILCICGKAPPYRSVFLRFKCTKGKKTKANLKGWQLNLSIGEDCKRFPESQRKSTGKLGALNQLKSHVDLLFLVLLS